MTGIGIVGEVRTHSKNKMKQSILPISVVIPCYRCALTIGRAVDSVFSQNTIPSELILVEDSSGDETFAVLQKLEQANRGRLKIIQMVRNQGAASARNAGWAIAKQPYIAFLDADDSWHPDKLRIQYEYMQSNPDVLLCGHLCPWLHENEKLPVLPFNFSATKISAVSLLFKNAFSTPTVMLKRDISFRFQEEKRCAEDLLLWQQVAFAGLQVARIESPLAYVHKQYYGGGGLSAQLWKMEKGELDNFVVLYREEYINFVQYLLATVFSIFKYIKRRLLISIKNLAK